MYVLLFCVVLLFLFLSVISTVNETCSKQTLILCMLRTRVILICVHWFLWLMLPYVYSHRICLS